METLTLNNGEVLENSTALETDGTLFIYTRNNSTVKGLCDALYLPENTVTIIAAYPGGETVYTGYNKLIAVRDEGGGLVTAVLKRTVLSDGGSN